MSIPKKGEFIELERVARANAAIEETKSARPELAELELSELLRVHYDRVTFLAEWNQRQVIVKQFLTEDQREKLEKVVLVQELSHTHLGDGPNQMAQTLWADAVRGLIVQECIDAPLVSQALRGADATEQIEIYRKCGAWLYAYTNGRGQLRTINFKRHLGKARKALELAKSHDLGDLAQEVFDIISDLAQMLSHHETHRGLTHGDFTALNMMYDGQVMFGIDLESTVSLCPLIDVARFMVTTFDLHPKTQGRRFGLNEDAFAALLDGYQYKSTPVNDAFLQFFVGRAILNYIEGHINSGRNIELAHSLARGYCEDYRMQANDDA